MRQLIICGDSFHCGIGCTNIPTQTYGKLTASQLGLELVMLARGSASNYIVSLQGKYAAHFKNGQHIVVLGTTSYDRVEWLAEGTSLDNRYVSLYDVNYHMYPPHYHTPLLHDQPIKFHLQDDPLYSPKIYSEQVVAFSDYFNNNNRNVKNGYYTRFKDEPIDKLKLIEHNYINIVDSHIKRDYDIGLILTAYTLLKKAGANCIIASDDTVFAELVQSPGDYFAPDWTRLVKSYPDTIGTLHTSEVGHADVAARLLKHIDYYGIGL